MRCGEGFPPHVSVLLIVSREKTNPDWVSMARESIYSQTFDRYEVVEIDNNENEFSIGACWNAGIAEASGEAVLIVGDDDWISIDYIHSLFSAFSEAKKAANVSSAHTYATIVDESIGKSGLCKKIASGMWDREFMIEHPFDETLKNQVDTAYFEKRDTIWGSSGVVIPWHFGYFYRQHDSMASGRKTMRVAK